MRLSFSHVCKKIYMFFSVILLSCPCMLWLVTNLTLILTHYVIPDHKVHVINILTLIFQSKDVTFRGHGDSVDQLCWHPKHPDQLVTASGDKTIRLWDARTNKSVATVNTKGKGITQLLRQ